MELSKQAVGFKLNQLDTFKIETSIETAEAVVMSGAVSTTGLVEYGDNAAAVAAGLEVGNLYTTAGAVKIVTA